MTNVRSQIEQYASIDAAMTAQRETVGEPSDGMKQFLRALPEHQPPYEGERFDQYLAGFSDSSVIERITTHARADAKYQFSIILHGILESDLGAGATKKEALAYVEDMFDQNIITFLVYRDLIDMIQQEKAPELDVDRFIHSFEGEHLNAQWIYDYYQSLMDYLRALKMTPEQRLEKARKLVEEVYTLRHLQTDVHSNDEDLRTNIAFSDSLEEIVKHMGEYLWNNPAEIHGVTTLPFFQERRKEMIMALKNVKSKIKVYASIDQAQLVSESPKGGIDLNSANLDLQIRRDGRGVPLPLDQQDMGQLERIEGFVPVITAIRPVTALPILNELQQMVHSS